MTNIAAPQIRNKNVGQPGNGGAFAGHAHGESAVSLEPSPAAPLFDADDERKVMEETLSALGKTKPATKECDEAYRRYHLATRAYELAAGVVDGVHPPKDLEPHTISAASAIQREVWSRHPNTAIRLAVASNPRTKIDTIRKMFWDQDFHVQDAAHLRLYGSVDLGNAHKREFEARTGRPWGSGL